MDPIVDANELPRLRNRGVELVIADVRWYLDGRSGREAFERGHLPGAIFVDLDRDLTGELTSFGGRHPFPSPELFAASMSALGIGDDSSVVAYDDSAGGTAGRLVVMLRMLGHDAALLDGGLASWDGPLEIGAGADATPKRFTPQPWPERRLVDFDELPAQLPVLDARSSERFSGESEPVEAVAGHIPGATSAPWTENLDPATQRFLSPEQLRQRFIRLGVTDAEQAICYCGSGVSACANLLALERAGLGDARLFVPSWSGWVARHG